MSEVPNVEPAGRTRVVDLDFRTDARWDSFVCGHPNALVFHHSAWLRTLEREYEGSFLGLACEDDRGRIQGVLPLATTRGLPLGFGGAGTHARLSSLPRTPIAGPLATNEEVLAALVRAAVERARARHVVLQLKPWGSELDGLVEELVGTPWRLTYVLDLPEMPDDLRFGTSRNHARIRWAVNKAARSGLSVRPAETERDLREWYALYLDVNRWRLHPSRPYRLFRAAWELMRPLGLMRLLLAEAHDGSRARVVAGSMLLMLGETVFYAFNGRVRESLPLRPNDLIQWHAIHDATRAGFRRYDFGEVAHVNLDLAAFKRKWGTHPHPLHRYYFPASPEGPAGYGVLESENLARRLGTKAWRRVPLRVTAMVGDRVYRYL
ncbi:MAG TPA: GNAT family N-acetyltransferase [Gaiellaceae bacterium]|nr:GNAT family N-acetyltransferase [Gaiellaceae bacterium]